MRYAPCSLLLTIMDNQPTPIKDIIISVVGLLTKEEAMERARVLDAWWEVIETPFKPHTKPVALKNRTLIIHVDESGWLYELTLHKVQILKKLQERAGECLVRDIKLRIGKV